MHTHIHFPTCSCHESVWIHLIQKEAAVYLVARK
uniref:Uncharacterized protein n=1 Tax=Anguilla anguilla TaxID=7936 RepID=A0A0E9TZH4_ANGAN